MKSRTWFASCSAAALVMSVAGSAIPARGDFVFDPTTVITWGGAGGVGRAVPGAPAGWTWVNNQNNNNSGACIGSDGRVYLVLNFTSTPLVGAIPVNNTKGFFTATNSTDLSLVQNMADNNAPGWQLTGQGAGVTLEPGATAPTTAATVIASSSGNLHVAGTQVMLGEQLHGPGITESGTTANNTFMMSGTVGGMVPVAAVYDSVTLPGLAGNAAGHINTNMKSVSGQNTDLNASGVSVLPLSVAADTTNFLSTTGTGNNWFLASKTVGGAYNVIAQGSAAAPNIAGGKYYNGSSNGVGGFVDRINASGQIAYDARLQDVGFVSTTNDKAGYLYDPTAGTNSTFYRSGDTAYGIGGQAFTSGGLNATKGFSNAGILYTTTLTGSDITTTAGSNNSFAMYLGTNATLGASNADRATNNTLIVRGGSPAPAFNITTGTATVANVNYNNVSTTTAVMNNAGTISYVANLQGAGVTSYVAPTTDQFGANPNLILTAGVGGNDAAICYGTAGNLKILMREGDPAPFCGNQYVSFHAGATSQSAINNLGQILFSTGLSYYAPGQAIGAVGGDARFTIASDLTQVLWGWDPSQATPYPIMETGDVVQVDPGVYKTVSTFSVNNFWEGGSAAGFNDAGQFLVSVTFTDGTWALVKESIPAPGSSVIGLAGLAALARRRR